jgi:hypothetical protein
MHSIRTRWVNRVQVRPVVDVEPRWEARRNFSDMRRREGADLPVAHLYAVAYMGARIDPGYYCINDFKLEIRWLVRGSVTGDMTT